MRKEQSHLDDARMDASASVSRLEAFRHQVHELARVVHADGYELPVVRRALTTLTALIEFAEEQHATFQRVQQQRQDEQTRLEGTAQDALLYFAHAPLPYLMTSLDGTIRQANEAAITLFDTDEAHLMGRSLTQFLHDGERQPFRDRLHQVVMTQETHTWTLDLRVHPRTRTPVIAAVCVVRGHKMQKPQSLRWQFVAYPQEQPARH